MHSRYQAIGFVFACALSAAFIEVPQSIAAAPESRVQFQRDDGRGEFWVQIDGARAFCYRYGNQVDLPHFFPINSPDGQSMTVQQTQPYPHHRSFWFGDLVSLRGQRKVATYNALYSGAKEEDGSFAAPFKDGIRHVRFGAITSPKDTGTSPKDTGTSPKDTGNVVARLLWYMDNSTPVLDEDRSMHIRALGDGQYFVDILFTVTANYGDLEFSSDDVHYAWPYLRLNSEFAVPGGASIMADSGPVTEARSTKVVANWIDYSHPTSGKNCGLAMFSHNDNPKPHRWLTRDYGTFGPRRMDAKSGKPFTLRQGESMTRRVGLLVHRGDVTTGFVAQRYSEYVQGRLQ